MKKFLKTHGLGHQPQVNPLAALDLEKTIQEQMDRLTRVLGTLPPSPPPSPAAAPKPPAPFPQALGRHLLTRLTQLEAAAHRLAAQAEKQGDYKSALRAVQVSVRIVTATVKLASKHPHLAENWQPPAADSRPAAAMPEAQLGAPPDAPTKSAAPATQTAPPGAGQDQFIRQTSAPDLARPEHHTGAPDRELVGAVPVANHAHRPGR